MLEARIVRVRLRSRFRRPCHCWNNYYSIAFIEHGWSDFRHTVRIEVTARATKGVLIVEIGQGVAPFLSGYIERSGPGGLPEGAAMPGERIRIGAHGALWIAGKTERKRDPGLPYAL